MNKKNIVIVSAISTGQYLVEDVIKRGYNPVVLKPIVASEDMQKIVDESYAAIPYKFDYIQASEDYVDTLADVKKYSPIHVIPGSEDGVVLAAKLANDLNLIGNPIENLPQMTEKPAMHEALRKAGIRYIEGKVVSSVEEGVKFYNDNNLGRAVVKPVSGAGSQGLYFCDNEDDLSSALAVSFDTPDFFGKTQKQVLVQKRIVGTEFVVNTVSCQGKHRLSSVHRYTRVPTKEGGNIYDFSNTVVELKPGHNDLISYAFKVADAIGFQYGEIHGEYLVDEDGPVLVEVNCRPMGASCPPEWLNKVFGQHETDSILDAYLEPEFFMTTLNKPYHPKNMAAIKLIMVPRDIEVKSLPVYEIVKNLRSFYKISAATDHTNFSLSKTRDLESQGGSIYLVHEDEDVVLEDLWLIKEIEANNFQLIANDGTSRPNAKNTDLNSDLNKVLDECDCHGSILVVTDDCFEYKGAVVKFYDELNDLDINYKNVVIDISKSTFGRDESQLLHMLFDIMKRVQVGGRVIFTNQCNYYLTEKKKTAETLMRVLGYRIEAPFYDSDDVVIGTRI